MNDVKKAKQIQKFSADYDMTIVIKYAFLLFGLFLLQLFVLEFLLRFYHKDMADKGYLTPEITHTIFGFIGGWIAAIVTFLSKRLADQKQPPRNSDTKQETDQK